ncbi:FkbM family methyltransferase [Ideonella livida]|uniref:FkbM family methyltransferase n=1 Tax=Ideonella livida TaxID=2707176 RepID=A0A7C9PJI9_9BURK|nr:FkbM family methyltransferase [Ideonella livida]NDY93576.1 FkbM family methyltransferase [Ideonella livida]
MRGPGLPSPRLQRTLQGLTRLPAWLDPLKAPLVAGGLALQEWGPLRPDPASPVHCEAGFALAGGPRAGMLNRIVAYRGLFEPGLTRFIQAQVQAGDVAVDLGANAGYFSLLLARQVGPQGRVLAVEAAPGNVRRLQANLAANPALSPQVQLVHAAVTDAEGARGGSCAFHVHARNDMHCRLAPPSRRELDGWLMGQRHWRTVQVPARQLGELLGPLAPQVSFLKLDIEGAEHRVLPELLDLCTHPRLTLALELKAPHHHRALGLLEAAGLQLHDLGNDYRWLLNRRPAPALRPLSYAQAQARRFMLDVVARR